MINTVCISIFKTLTESELKAFGSYLTASYQKAGSIYKLYNFLRKNHPDLAEEKIARKVVEKKLFKEKADPERTLFDTTSKLTAKLKSFITTQELEQHEVYQNFLYLEALKSRKLDTLFFKKAESLQKKWDDDSIPGIEHLHNQYKLKVLNYSHPNFSVQKIKKEYELKNIIDLLDRYYLTTRLYYTLIYNINNKEMITEKYSANKLLEDFDHTTFSNMAKTKLLHNFLTAYQLNSVADFRKIKSIFFNKHNHFTQSEKHDIVSILNYFFYSKRNEINVTKELFEITKFSLEEKLLLEDGYLNDQSYINCILTAKANHEIDWIETFIQQNKHLLNEDEKNNSIMFGEIILKIERKEFEDALEKLALIRVRNPIRVAQLNCCRLQCFYEMDYELPFYNALNASKQYLLNHKHDFTNAHLETFRSFISSIKDIFKIRAESKSKFHKKNLDLLHILTNKILKKDYTPYDKKWLLLKIKEFKNTLKQSVN